jgi:hypothetical protein
MTKFVDGEEITFRKHILDIKNIAEVIDNLCRIFQRKLALLDKTLGRVHTDRDPFSMVTSFLREALDILEITNRVSEKLPVNTESRGGEGGGYVSGHDGCGLEFDTLEILRVGWSLALFLTVIVWFLRDDGHVTQGREVRRDDQSRGKRRLERRLIKTRNNPPCITRLSSAHITNGVYLALAGKHVCLFAVCIGIRTAVKPGHGVIQDAVKGHGKNTLATVMTDLFAEFEGCGAVLVVVGDVLCRDGGFGFRLGGLDTCFVDLEFVRIQHNLVFKRIQLFQTTQS